MMARDAAIMVADRCAGERGVYIARRVSGLYIGQSTNPSERIGQHAGHSDLLWAVFVAPEASSQVDNDVLMVAEALLISFWGEVAVLENIGRGIKQRPKSEHRQQGVLLAKGAAAACLWLLRHQADLALPALGIPLKNWRMSGWPACYLQPLDKLIIRDCDEYPQSDRISRLASES